MLPAKETQVRFLKSLTVGGVAFLVQYGALWILKGFMAHLTAYHWAYAISVVTHYSLNRFWALKSSRRDTGRQLLEYLGTVLVGLVIQFSIAWFCVRVVHIYIMWVPVFAVPPSTVAVILILNYQVFRKHA